MTASYRCVFCQTSLENYGVFPHESDGRVHDDSRCKQIMRGAIEKLTAQRLAACAGLERIDLCIGESGTARIEDKELRRHLRLVAWVAYVEAGGQGNWGKDLDVSKKGEA